MAVLTSSPTPPVTIEDQIRAAAQAKSKSLDKPSLKTPRTPSSQKVSDGGEMAGKLAAPIAFFFVQKHICALISRLITKNGAATQIVPDIGEWDLIRTWLPLPTLDSSAPVLYCFMALLYLTRFKDHRKIGRAVSHGFKVLIFFMILCSEFQFLTLRKADATHKEQLGFPYFNLSMGTLSFSAYGILFTLIALLLNAYEKLEVDGVLWYLIAMCGTVSSGHAETIELVRTIMTTAAFFKYFVVPDSMPPSGGAPRKLRRSSVKYLAKAQQRQQKFAQKVDARLKSEEETVEYGRARPETLQRRVRKQVASSYSVTLQGPLSGDEAAVMSENDAKDETQFDSRRRTEVLSPSKAASPFRASGDLGSFSSSLRPRPRVEQAYNIAAATADELRKARAEYLDLLRETLTLAPYQDDSLFVEHIDGTLSVGGRYRPGHREEGTDFPLMAHTRIGRSGLRTLQACMEDVVVSGVPGDILDTRPWRGGFGVFCRSLLKIYQDTDKKVWLINIKSHRLPRLSFVFYILSLLPAMVMHAVLYALSWIPVLGVSLPKMSQLDLDRLSFYFRNADLHQKAHVDGMSLHDVTDLFSRYNLMDRQTMLSDDAVGSSDHYNSFPSLSLLRIGGHNARKALNAYYHKVSPGGYIFVDEFDMPGGCKEDVREFLSQRLARSPEIRAFGDGRRVYWRVEPKQQRAE